MATMKTQQSLETWRAIIENAKKNPLFKHDEFAQPYKREMETFISTQEKEYSKNK